MIILNKYWMVFFTLFFFNVHVLSDDQSRITDEYILPLRWDMSINDIKSTYPNIDVKIIAKGETDKTVLVYGTEFPLLGTTYSHIQLDENGAIKKIVISTIEIRKKCIGKENEIRKKLFCRDTYNNETIAIYNKLLMKLKNSLGNGIPNRLTSDHHSDKKQESMIWILNNMQVSLTFFIDEEGLWSTSLIFDKK